MRKKVDLTVNGDEFKLDIVTDLEPELKVVNNERNLNKEVNGFTKKKTLRRVAFIPIEALLALGEEGAELMRDTTPEKLKKFLERHPEFKLVNNL